MANQGIDFDQAAGTWDQDQRRVRQAQDVAQAMTGALPLGPDLTMMDFGCGTGLLSLLLRPLVGRLVGVDTSAGMLEALKAKIAAQGIANMGTHLLADDDTAPLPGPCDVIVSNMTLHHVPDVPGLIARLRAALKPGGWLALADLDPEGGQFHPSDDGVYHNGIERPWLRQLLEDAGFQQVRAQDAAVMNKPDRSGQPRDFSIFLITARLPL